jgi:hypothetical protein
MKIDKSRLSSSLAIEKFGRFARSECANTNWTVVNVIERCLNVHEQRFYYPLVVIFRLIFVKGKGNTGCLCLCYPLYSDWLGIGRQGFSEVAQGPASAIPLPPPTSQGEHIYTRYHSEPKVLRLRHLKDFFATYIWKNFEYIWH